MFDLAEARFVQLHYNTSAADSLTIYSTRVPPENKVWQVLSLALYPSVTENRTFVFEKQKGGWYFAITRPYTGLIGTAAIRLAGLESGDEMLLLPGEQLGARRDVATAGSTLSIMFEFVEHDLPLYDYIEPQLARRLRRGRTELLRRVAAGGGGTGGGEAPPRFDDREPGGGRVPPAI